MRTAALVSSGSEPNRQSDAVIPVPASTGFADDLGNLTWREQLGGGGPAPPPEGSDAAAVAIDAGADDAAGPAAD